MFIAIAIFTWLAVLLFVLLLTNAAKRSDEHTAELLAERAGHSPPAKEPERQRPSPAVPAATAVAQGQIYGSFLLKRLAIQARRIMAADRCAILLEEPDDPRSLAVVAAHGMGDDFVAERIAADVPMLAQTLNHGRCVSTDVAQGDSALRPILGDATRAIVAPVDVPGGGRGVLIAANSAGRPTLPGAELAGGLAELAATVIDDARSRQDLEHAIVGAPLALAELVSTYRRLHGEPAQDSAALACNVGRVLGLDDVALLELRLAATLQHVGRLLLDGDDDEECMEAEAVAAAGVLAGIAGLEVVAIVVRHRAEHWSGRGGPDGLAGERIPLASRILAVCRAYERLGDTPEASSALWGEGGGRFDPVVVGALAEVVDPVGSGSTRKFLRAWGRGDLTFAC